MTRHIGGGYKDGPSPQSAGNRTSTIYSHLHQRVWEHKRMATRALVRFTQISQLRSLKKKQIIEK